MSFKEEVAHVELGLSTTQRFPTPAYPERKT